MTNAMAYHVKELIAAVKSFIVQALGLPGRPSGGVVELAMTFRSS